MCVIDVCRTDNIWHKKQNFIRSIITKLSFFCKLLPTIKVSSYCVKFF